MNADLTAIVGNYRQNIVIVERRLDRAAKHAKHQDVTVSQKSRCADRCRILEIA